LTKDPCPVAVTSRSFSRNPTLRRELLSRHANVTFNDAGRTLRGAELAEFLKGAVMAITALEPIDEQLLSQLPDLKLISKVGVGTDMIDFEACAQHGIEVRTAGGTNSRSVAELALMLALCLLRHVPALRDELRAGGWRQAQGRELSGATVGIVGYGSVGRELRRLLAPFGCDVLIHDVREIHEDDVRQVDLPELLQTSDVVSLHVNLDDSTYRMIDAPRLALMKPSAVIINTARGGLIDEAALKQALREGRLAGAACDVFEQEPPEDAELLTLSNFLGTPHIGGSTEEAVLAMGRAAIAGLG
jgi:phosphoglycerate dehydrogenase-like enzyme